MEGQMNGGSNERINEGNSCDSSSKEDDVDMLLVDAMNFVEQDSLRSRISELENQLKNKTDECLKLSNDLKGVKLMVSGKDEEIRRWRLKVQELKAMKFKSLPSSGQNDDAVTSVVDEDINSTPSLSKMMQKHLVWLK